MDDKSKRSIAISKIMGFIAIGMAMLTVTGFYGRALLQLLDTQRLYHDKKTSYRRHPR